MVKRVVILDGYTDEPAGLGVPPYIDVYPRYIAGAFWYYDKSTKISYYTIDQARENLDAFLQKANASDYTVVIAGVVVPGKYIGGTPISADELIFIGKLLTNTFSILVGPVARFGIGTEGGKVAKQPSEFKPYFGALVTGDPESYITELLIYGVERANVWEVRKDYGDVKRFAIVGASIVRQHPNYGYNLTAEIETYRGCSRWLSGGCSFCIEPLYGKPIQRDPEDVIGEIEALYNNGVRSFRLGRQPDLISYGSKELGQKEIPTPDFLFLEHFFAKAREVAKDSVIHIDNVNPLVIANHPSESAKALEAVVKYHTEGDVAAFGIESVDENVIRVNNLKTNEEESLVAVRIVNKIGAVRGPNGMPHLLPGINFILGLPGETKETFDKNLEFLEKIYKEKLLVRRINIRKVLVLPTTRLYRMWDEKILKEHEEEMKHFSWVVRHVYDLRFLKMMLPKGSILRDLYVEKTENGKTYARQLGTYPLLAEIEGEFRRPCVLDVEITGYKGRSVKAKPISSCKRIV